MRFSWDFLQNMLENGHSNLQTRFGVHITSNIFKIFQFKNHRIAPTPPHLPTLKAYPTPGVGGRFEIFSLKWRKRTNLKVPGAILPLGCAILNTRAKTVREVVATPFGELGLMKTCLVIAYTIKYRQLQYTKLLHTSKELDRFNWNLKFTSVEWRFFKWNRKLNCEK